MNTVDRKQQESSPKTISKNQSFHKLSNSIKSSSSSTSSPRSNSNHAEKTRRLSAVLSEIQQQGLGDRTRSHHAMHPLPESTAIDRLLYPNHQTSNSATLFSPDESPLQSPLTTPSTTPMCGFTLNSPNLVPATPSGTPLHNNHLDLNAGSTNLRQALLKRRRTESSTSAASSMTTSPITPSNNDIISKDHDEIEWPSNDGPICARIFWWCLYTCYFTFFVFVGEILPAMQEGVIQASHVFLRVPTKKNKKLNEKEDEDE